MAVLTRTPMTEAEFRQALLRGNETRDVEFKGPCARRRGPMLARVIRAMLAMSNLPDGGFVIIGVVEEAAGLVPRGLDSADASTWKHDHLATDVAPYAEPGLTFEVQHLVVDAATHVILRVHPFEEVPVICKKTCTDREGDPTSGKVILRESAVYVRGLAKIESHEVSTHAEMREVIERAAEFRARRLLASLRRIAGPTFGVPTEPSDDDRYAAELARIEK